MTRTNRLQGRWTKNISQKLKLFAGGGFILAGLYYFSFNDYGIQRHFRIRKELQRLRTQIQTLESQQRQIKENIDKLNYDYDYLEKLIRERLHMVKNGEELYLIKKSKTGIHLEQR